MESKISDALSAVYQKLVGWVQQLIILLPNIIVGVLIFTAFYILGKQIRKWVSRPVHKISHSSSMAELLLSAAFVAIVALGLFIALSVMQLDKAVTSLLAGAGILGLAIGFAFQDIAANLVSGVMMAFIKPMKIGDVIESNDYLGTVIDINLRSSIIRTFQGQQVHIPNKDIFTKPLKNFSTEGYRRVDLECGISYGDDLEKVKRVVVEAIASIDYLEHGRGISFYYTSFGDSSINFVVRYWIEYHKQPDFLQAQSDGIMKIKQAFDQHDIMIPFPIRTLDFGIKGGEKLQEQLSFLDGNGKSQES